MYHRRCDDGANSFLPTPLFYRCSAVPLSKWDAYPGRLRRRLRRTLNSREYAEPTKTKNYDINYAECDDELLGRRLDRRSNIQ